MEREQLKTLTTEDIQVSFTLENKTERNGTNLQDMVSRATAEPLGLTKESGLGNQESLEVGDWESREEKTQTIVEIQNLEKIFQNNPDDIELAKSIEALKTKVLERDKKLIYWTVLHKAPWLSRQLSDDVILSAGSIGTLQAIEKFDATRGNHFTTYQVPAIINAIDRVARKENSTIHKPHNVQSLLEDTISLQERMIQEKSRFVDFEEAIEAMDISGSERDLLKKAASTTRKLSLDVYLSGVSNRKMDESWGGRLTDSNPTPEDDVVRSEMGRYIQKVLVELTRNKKYGKGSLTFHETRVLDLRFGLTSGIPLDIEELAEELGIKRGSVTNILTDAYRKIRNSPYADELLEYLRSVS